MLCLIKMGFKHAVEFIVVSYLSYRCAFHLQVHSLNDLKSSRLCFVRNLVTISTILLYTT